MHLQYIACQIWGGHRVEANDHLSTSATSWDHFTTCDMLIYHQLWKCIPPPPHPHLSCHSLFPVNEHKQLKSAWLERGGLFTQCREMYWRPTFHILHSESLHLLHQWDSSFCHTDIFILYCTCMYVILYVHRKFLVRKNITLLWLHYFVMVTVWLLHCYVSNIIPLLFFF